MDKHDFMTFSYTINNVSNLPPCNWRQSTQTLGRKYRNIKELTSSPEAVNECTEGVK